MANCADLTTKNQTWAIMIYGPAGAGKTHFIGTMPKPIFIFDWDRGIKSLIRHPDRAQIDYIQPDLNDWTKTEKFWNDFIVGKDATWKDPDSKVNTYNLSKYATIAVDSLTTMVDVLMGEVAEHVRMKDRVIVGSYKAPHMADYNVAANAIAEATKEAQETKKNIVFATHERIEKDRNSDTIARIGPSLAPSIYQRTSIMLDEIWRIDSRPGRGGVMKHILITGPDGYFVGKSRTIGSQRIEIEDNEFDTFAKILALGRT